MTENPSYSSVSVMRKRNHAGIVPLVWVTLFVVATLALLVGGYAYYRSETNRIRQQKHDEIAAIANLKAAQVRQWRQSQLEDVEAVAKGPMFKKAINEWLRGHTKGAPREDLTDKLIIVQQEMKYVDAILVDPDGHVLLSARPKPEPMTATEEKALQKALAKRSSVLTDLYRNPHGAILMTAVAPLTDPNGRPIAVVLLRSDPGSLLYPLIQSWPTPSGTAETLLVRKDGDNAFFLNDLRHRPNSALSLSEPLARQELPAAQAVQGKQGIFQGRDYRGVEVLADLSPIPGSPWFMVTKVDAREILAEARYRGSVTVIFAILFILLAASATAFGYRHRQAQLYQDLYRSELDQREAQEQFRTILYSIGDAVITTDTGGMVKQMNPAAEALTGWPENEAVGKPLEQVFRIINEETRQPCGNPAQKVLQHGQIVGLANHTILIGRDGTERALADSGAPIQTENGEILGAVLVFRDVTERRLAEERVRRQGALLSALNLLLREALESDSDADIARACLRVAEEITGSRFGFIGEINEAGHLDTIALSDPGWSDCQMAKADVPRLINNMEIRGIWGSVLKEDRPQLVNDPASRPDSVGVPEGHPVMKSFMGVPLRRSGKTFGLIALANKDGGYNPYDLEDVEALASVFVEALDRRRTERALLVSQEKYRNIFENAVEGICQTSPAGRLITVNPAYARMFGYGSPEEMIREVTDIASELYANPLDREEVKRSFEDTFALKHYEIQCRRKDGTHFWVSMNARSVRDESGRILWYEGMTEDISARKETEEALRMSEALLKEAQRVAHIGHWELDSPTGAPIWSKEIFHIFGLDPAQAEPSFAAHRDLIHPEDWELMSDSVTRGAGEGIPFDIDFRLIRPDRSIRWMNAKGYPTTKREAGFFWMFGTAQDITDRKLAEEELARSEQLLQAVLDASPAGIALLRSRQLQWGNKTLEDILGVSVKELRGCDVSRFYADDEEYRRVGDTIYPGLARGAVGETEVLLKHSDGSIFPALLRVTVVDEHPGGQIVVALFMDITDRKRAEEALRVTEKRYRDLVENANDIIYRTDANGFFVLFNPVGLRITGYSREEISHKHYLELVHPDYKKQVERFYGLQFVKRIPDTYYQVPIITKDGNTIWIGQNVQLVAEGDTVIGFQCIARDITDRKMAEDSLRRSEERLQLALQGADLGMWDLHVPTGQAFTNERTAEIVGYSLDEIEQTFSFWETLLHPDDRERALKPLYDHLAGLTDYSEQEYRARHKNGDWRWIYARGRITERDPDGKPLRMTGTFLDITDRKLAESQAAEANEFREKIIAASPVGIAVYRADGQCVSVNEELGRIVGTDKERLLGQNFRNLSSWKDYGLLADAEQVLSGGANNQSEVQLISTFGKNMWVNSRMARFTSGGQHHLLLVMNDISERRTAEDALKFEREQLLSLFESINEVILVIDPNSYEILFANKFTEDLYGKKLIGGVCYEKLNGLNAPCEHCLNDKILELQGTPYQWEYGNPVLKRDFLATDRMIRWPDGRDVKFQIAIDITARKEAQEEQDQLRAQLFQAQKMEAVGTLAGGIAHDFNNLLTVVMGFSELLLAEKDQQHPEYADLQKIFHAAENGADLIQRLLTFSRKAEPKPVPMNLNKQIVQVEKLLRRTIPRMVDIKLELSADLPQINADPSQVEQVIMNLAVNARDAMPDKGKLTLRTDIVTLDEEYCRLNVETNPGKYVLLEISDTGHGMDKETVAHIFEPFFTTKEIGRGTGLGLAMVYGIVKQHNGHITVDSEVGRGTSFKVYLPAIPAEAESEIEEGGIIPAFGTETLLLADDEQFVRELGARILTKHGYTVLQAKNGRQAIDLFKKERSQISLVILDLIMPEMSGTECLRELLKVDPQVNVLIASGFSADTSVKETIEMGAKGFVGKPFRVKELLRDVRKVLDSK